MSVYWGDMEHNEQQTGAPNSEEAPADYSDPFHFPVCRADDPPSLVFDPARVITPTSEPQTTMGPADPNAPRLPEDDDGPFSEQTRDLLHHPIPEWEEEDPNLEAGE